MMFFCQCDGPWHFEYFGLNDILLDLPSTCTRGTVFVVSRGAVRSMASSYAAMRMVAGSRLRANK